MLTALALALIGPFALQEPLPPLPPPPPSPAPAPAPVIHTEQPPPPALNADAPGEHTHDGFYARLSLGVGSVGVNGTAPGGGDASIHGRGASFLLALGGTPARGLVTGGALLGVSNADQKFNGGPSDLGGATWNGGFGALDFFVDWFPDEKDGWHVGAMIGYAGVQTGESTTNVKWYGNAANARLFGGYDFWIARQLSLGVGAALDGTTTASLRDSDNRNDTGYQLRAAAIVIDVSLLVH